MYYDKIKNAFLKDMFELIDFRKSNYLFNDKIKLDDFIVQVIFEILKDDLYAKDPVKSLLQCLKEDDFLSSPRISDLSFSLYLFFKSFTSVC